MRRVRKRFKPIALSVGFILVIVGLTAIGLSGLSSVYSLRTDFPLVIYRGPDEDPDVKIVRRKPMQWVTLSEISKPAVSAIMISEDWAFFQHKGVDWNEIQKAAKKDLKEKRFARGASTITQQVAKNVFLDHERSLLRKARELLLAIQLEKVLKKNRILEIYLNIAEWGEGVYGIRAASWQYFKKHPSQLSAKEGAFLAMLLPSPKRYSTSFDKKKLTDYARETIESILRKMVQARYMTTEEMQMELRRPLPFELGSD